MENSRNCTLNITVFGKFSIECLLPESKNRAGTAGEESNALKRHSFLQFLCVFHKRAVSQEELIDAIIDEEKTENPTKALKNMLYRARLLLEEKGFPDGKKILRYNKGFYSWDPNLEIVLDSEEFDTCCDIFEDDPHSEKGWNAAEKAKELFKGEFLPNMVSTPWTLSLRTYYHTKYLNLIKNMARLLYERGDQKRAFEFCNEAATADPYDEESHLLLMKILHAEGSTSMAISHYEMISNMFMNQLGVTPGEEITELYRSMVRENEPREHDLTVIRSRMLEESSSGGAYYCDYEVFRNVYRFIARSTLRSGQVVQLVMIILYDKDNNYLEGEACVNAMKAMQNAIQNVLRVGDIFTRFGKDQYLLLLPSASHENAAMALGRVIESFRSTFAGKTTRTQVSILPVLPPRSQNGRAIEEGFVPIEAKSFKK